MVSLDKADAVIDVFYNIPASFVQILKLLRWWEQREGKDIMSSWNDRQGSHEVSAYLTERARHRFLAYPIRQNPSSVCSAHPPLAGDRLFLSPLCLRFRVHCFALFAVFCAGTARFSTSFEPHLSLFFYTFVDSKGLLRFVPLKLTSFFNFLRAPEPLVTALWEGSVFLGSCRFPAQPGILNEEHHSCLRVFSGSEAAATLQDQDGLSARANVRRLS